MGSNGIKIVKDGKSIETSLNIDNIDDFSFISGDPTLMIVKTTISNGGTYNHNLGYKPFFIVFSVDDVDSPTIYTRDLFIRGVTADSVNLYNLPSPCYVILFAENY